MFTVKWTKYFVSGSLKGLTYDSSLSFNSLATACEYVVFLHKHTTEPVETVSGGSNYTCHDARICA